MWPLLLASVVALGTTIERLIFLFRLRRHRETEALEQFLQSVSKSEIERATAIALKSRDPRLRVLSYGLKHRDEALSEAMLRAAKLELRALNRAIPVLDTVVTLAPLLGLLGTVTGMIGAFGLLGASELDAPTAITGGIAEALIATAFGLTIAICSLIPLNMLHHRGEKFREELEDACSRLELVLKRQEGNLKKQLREAA